MRTLLLVLALAVAAPLAAQTDDPGALAGRLRQRYDVLPLQNGVGLVPRDGRSAVRLIEIRDGAVALDGREVTGRELRDQLGADADLILRVSYLDVDEQRELVRSSVGVSRQTPDRGLPPAPDLPDAPALPEPPEAPEPPESADDGRSRRNEIVRIGGSVRVGRDEVVDNEVVVVMGSAHIDGEVRGEVSVIMGSLHLGPEAIVRGEVNVIGGSIQRQPGARILGQVHEVAIAPHIDFGHWGGWGGVDPDWGPRAPFPMPSWRIGALAATLMRVAIVAMLALIVVALGRTWIERIADHTAVDPLRAGLVGFFAELLFIPLLVIVCIVLAVSIIGIPLLLLVPFGVLFALLLLLVGFTGVAFQVGRWMNGRFGWTGRGPYATTVVGVVAIAAFTMLARSLAIAGGGLIGVPLGAFGWVVEYVAWTIGLGGAIQVWLASRRRAVPPPIPA